jgi:hypothetical protein
MSEQVSTDFIDFARKMVSYFGRNEAEQGDRWTSGRVAVQAWLDVLLDETLSPEALQNLDQLMLQGSDETGSAWIDVRMFYNAWRLSPQLQRRLRDS